MTDVTEAMNAYRECARGLWNNFLRRGADFDMADTFSVLSDRLFGELVLRPLGERGYKKASVDDPYPFLRVMPVVDPVPIMINRPSQDRNKYWDEPVTKLGLKGLSLLFIDYFDWEQLGVLDLQYYRVRIVQSDEQPHVAGRVALVDVHYAQVAFENDRSVGAPL